MTTTPSKKTTSNTTKPASKTTLAKTAASKPKPAIKKVPSPQAVAPKPMMGVNPAPAAAGEAKPAMTGPEMKKQELIEKVVRLSGAKKKDAKPVIEAMLEVLGEALADGRELNLHPLGKVKLNRTKETPNARIIVAKIRQSKRAAKSGLSLNQTVAAAAE